MIAPASPRLNMSFTWRGTCAGSSDLYPTFMWFDPPNQAIRCAYIFVVEPGYNKVVALTLLMLFFPERFPFDDPPKFGLVLLLFPVSAARVVVGTTWVTAKLDVGPRTTWDNTAIAQNFVARLIIRPPGFVGQSAGPFVTRT